jgi:hypothetical protein
LRPYNSKVQVVGQEENLVKNKSLHSFGQELVLNKNPQLVMNEG